MPAPEDWVTSEPKHRDVAWLLHWAGITLLGVYVTTLLFIMWPFALLQPAWQQRIGSSLHGSASFALEGAVLLVLAHLVAPEVDTIANRVRWMRRMASWAAIGFALLVPLQIYSGAKLISERTAQERQQLQGLSRTIIAIEKADSEAQLKSILEGMQGVPELQGKLPKPFEELRDTLVDRLRPELKRLETKSLDAQRNRWESWLVLLLRNSLVTVLYAIAFAAIGQVAPGRSTLLTALTSFRRPGSGRGWSLVRNKHPQVSADWMDLGTGEKSVAPSRPRPPRKPSRTWGRINKNVTGPVDLSEWVDGEESGDSTRE